MYLESTPVCFAKSTFGASIARWPLVMCRRLSLEEKMKATGSMPLSFWNCGLGTPARRHALSRGAAVNERAFIIQDDGVEQPAGFDIEGEPFT
jgi:hypothetical protein